MELTYQKDVSIVVGIIPSADAQCLLVQAVLFEGFLIPSNRPTCVLVEVHVFRRNSSSHCRFSQRWRDGHQPLKNVLSLLNIDINALLLKGRDNYICLNRLDQIELSSNDLVRNFECHDFAAIIAWSFYTKSGDVDECSSFSLLRSARIWNLLKSDVRFCQKQCGHSDSCFYSKNLDCINNSNVIVVNHALLMSDALDSRNLLPKEHLYAIDEAHELFKATKHILTYTYDKSFFNNFVTITSLVFSKAKSNFFSALVSKNLLSGSSS